MGAVVDLALPEAAHKLSYVKLTGESNGDAGDQYTGLDRFGRVVDQRWLTVAGDFVRDRYGYGYDRDGNRIYRENLVDSAFSELYSYDGLNRLTDMQRGTLNGTKDGIVGSASRTQSWDLDALGNMDTVSTDGTPESRDYDAQNELTQIGSTTLGFDANGNLTTDQNGKTLVYDAWNRLIEQKDGTTSEIAYAYDGMGRRIAEGITDVYFSAAWQVIEERDPSTQITTQYVWSPVYVDAMILKDRDFDGDGLTDERTYVLQDANWNVTALLDTQGDVMERFTYDAYGKRSELTENWFPTTDSGFQYGHQGGRIDAVTGRINFRNRDYDTDLMRWVQQDYKAGYMDGLNLYQYEVSSPGNYLDSSGEYKLEIRYSRLGWIPFLGSYYHGYVVVTDTDGSQYYWRAGPSSGGPSSGASGALGSGSGGSSSANRVAAVVQIVQIRQAPGAILTEAVLRARGVQFTPNMEDIFRERLIGKRVMFRQR